MPSNPSLAALSTRSRGNSPLWSIASARGFTSCSANSRASLRISCCSGLKERSITPQTLAWHLSAARVGRRAGVHADDGRLALRHSRADAGGAVAAAPLAEREDEVHQNARARRANRMADGERAAVDVDALLIDPEQVHCRTGDRGEGLVDFEEAHIVDP